MTDATKRRRFVMPPVGPAVQVGCIALALVLGFWGFTSAYAAAGIAVPLIERGQMAVRLIVGGFPDDLDRHNLPLQLWIARYALPLLTTWTTIALAWRQVRNPFRLWRIRQAGEHLVLSGDDGLARRVGEAELARGRRVLVWTDDATARWVTDLVELGAAQVGGAPDERLALGKARAALLVAADDTANAALATTLVDAAQGTRPPGDPLDVIVRVDDLDLRRGIERRFERPAPASARVRFAALPDLAARQLFVEAPLDGFRRGASTQRTVFFLGFTPAIERYVVRLLAGSHFRDGGKPSLVAVDSDPSRAEQGFRARNPQVDRLNPVVFEHGDVDRPSAGDALIAELVARHGAPAAVIVDAGEDARTIALGLAVADHFAAKGEVAPPIHVRLASDRDALLGVTLRAFGTLDRFADPELLLQEDHDALARSIHDLYLQGRFDEGEQLGTRASMHEWEDLPETFRDDNRLVADCYALKLRDIGTRVVPGTGAPMRIEPAELEELARAEHDRWMGAKLADGWVHGDTRDDAAKRHPDIVPYDDLTERIKDLDREQVRAITRLLSVAGRRALRVLTIAVDPAFDADAVATVAALGEVLATHYPDRVAMLAGDPTSAAAPLLAAADAAGLPVTLTLTEPADALVARNAAGTRVTTVALLNRADTIVALPDGAAARAWAEAHAQLRLTSDMAAAGEGVVVVSREGAIVRAPWLR